MIDSKDYSMSLVNPTVISFGCDFNKKKGWASNPIYM